MKTLFYNSLLFTLFSTTLTLSLPSLLFGCGGGSNSTEGTGGAGTGGAGTGGAGTGGAGTGCYDYANFKSDTPVSFKNDVVPIFQNSCTFSSCHGSESAAASDPKHYLGPKKGDVPTDVQLKTIIDQNVGMKSVENPDMPLVDPMKPENSFLMYKIDGLDCPNLTCNKSKVCGSLMPQGFTEPMEAQARDKIRAWIKQGAKNN